MSPDSRLVWLAAGLFAAGLVPVSFAQTPAEDLDSKWVAICAGATPGTPLGDRCDEILNAGPGSGDRRSEAALGNNLDIAAAAGRLATRPTDDVERFEAGAWNLFFGGTRAEVDRDSSPFENAFDSETDALQFGIDRRVGRSSVLGLMLNASDTETVFAESAGQLESDLFSATVFFNAVGESGHGWDAYAGFGNADYDSVRAIDYTLVLDAGLPSESTVTITGTGIGSTDADHLMAGFGWSYELGDGKWSYGPIAGLDYADTDIDAYVETDDVGLALAFNAQSVSSLRANAGFEAIAALSRSWGVLTPQFRGGLVHEFDDDERTIASRFAGDTGGTALAINTEQPDRDYFDLGFGLAFTFKNDVVLFFDVGARLGHSFLDDQSAALGLRFPIGGS